MKLFPILALAIFMLAGCASAPLAAREIAPARPGTIMVNGQTRTYVIHRPASLRQAAPLVLVLHGGGGNGAEMQSRTRFDRVADQNKFVVVYPNSAIAGADAQRTWNDGRDTDFIRGVPEIDDVAFLTALIDDLARRGIADPARVYLAGGSNGAMMSMRYACDRPDRVRAIVSVTGNLPVGQAAKCQAQPPVPIFIVKGDQDRVLPVQGGRVMTRPSEDRGAVVSIGATLDYWKARNGCTGDGVTTMLADRAPNDGTRVQSTIWSPCSNNTAIWYYNIIGGGHTWPGLMVPEGRAQRAGLSSMDIDMAPDIWRFFAQY